MTNQTFNGRVAIVTGSGQGIGRCIALAFAQRGADVVVVDYHGDRAEKVAAEIGELDRKSLPLALDISQPANVQRMVEDTVRAFSKVDILVNNAGLNALDISEAPAPGQKMLDRNVWRAAFLDLTEEQWDRMMDVNAKGTFLCSQAVARNMVKHGRGWIVSFSSIAINGIAQGIAPYVASKGAISALTKAMAYELGPMGINVNSVAPGVTESDWVLSHLASEHLQLTRENTPRRAISTPEEISNVVLFLCSEDSVHINGQTLHVNGGAFMP